MGLRLGKYHQQQHSKSGNNNANNTVGYNKIL